MKGRYTRISPSLGILLFFAVLGKPLSSNADTSTQAGLGAIPYGGIWTNGSTAGNGFGTWQLSPATNGGNAFFYVQNSTINNSVTTPGNGSNDINSAGVAWGISALNGSVASATRPFPGALTTSQSFQMDMDNGNIASSSSVGFALQNGSSSSVLEFFFLGGSANYTINAGSTNVTTIPFTRAGLHTTFTLTSASTYSLNVLAYTPGGAPGAGTSYNFSGNLINPSGGQSITSVRLFNNNAGVGTNNNAYFNNMSISGGAASDAASNAAYNTAGTTFRVWAPNATAMHVEGTWNSFSTTATPLSAEGNGNWSADVPGALNGHQFQYYISNSTVGTNVTKQDPRSRSVVNSAGRSIIYNTTNFNWAGDNFTTAGVSNTVLYELNISTFNGGNFSNAMNRLPFLKQLGVNGVEVMPIGDFPGNSGWGYNPADPFAVEDAYGGPDAFKSFVKTAHQLGIAVLLDTVQNHYGGISTNDGYGDLYHSLWQFDGSSSGAYGGIYFYQDSCRAFAQTWGPRPDFDTTQVYQYIRDNIIMWMNECHVDGFRWDSVGEIEGDFPCNDTLTSGKNLIADVSGVIHSQPGSKINIGEDNPNNQFGANGFDGTWNNNAFFGYVIPQLTTSSDSNRDMSAISTAVNIGNNGHGPSGWGNVVFLEDHDQSGCVSPPCSEGGRLPYRIDNNNPVSYYARKRSTLGAAITLSTAGIPMLLSGQEMLTTNEFTSNTALNWSLTNTYSGIVSFYTDMIRLRRNLDGRSSGLTVTNAGTIWEDDSNKIIAYRRGDPNGDDVVVICNFKNTSWPSYNVTGFPHDGTWYVQLNSDWTKYSSDYGNYGSSISINVSGGTGTISIAPYSVLVLSQHIPGAPPVPQGLTATTASTNQINLSWSISSAATGYVVKRAGSQIGTTASTSFPDIGLAGAGTYCYTVEATNIGGVSADSTSACATTLTATTATNLLAYWTFDEGGGTTAYDYSGNSNTGTVVVGGGQWNSGIVNGDLSFDGVATQVTATNSATLNPVGGITLAAWVYDASGGWFNTPRILEKGKTDNQYALFINSSGSLEFLLTGVANGVLSITPPSSGIWHHLAGTYDGSSLISLYIDGLLATQQVASGIVVITTDPLAIGNKPTVTSPFNFFYGNIDDVRIYGSALPPSQITQLYRTDSVGDGVPNWWRQQYFGVSSFTDATTCASCDYDLTGQNNMFKYVAGLDPTDPTQIFTLQIANVTNQPSQMNLTFNPVVNLRTYTIQASPDLTSGSFGDLSNPSDPQTNGTQVTVTDLNAVTSNNFYRVHISLP